MRIVYYTPGWPPERFPNGIVSAIATLAPALEAAGHEPWILAHHGEPDPRLANVGFVDAERRVRGFRTFDALAARIAPRRALFEMQARQIAARLNADKTLAAADIIEMEESFGWSAIIARRVRPPLVTRLHGPYFLTGAAGRDEPFSALEEERVRREGRAIAASLSVTAPSKFVLDAARARYCCALPDAAVIPNPVRSVDDDGAWRLDRAERGEILFVGRFERLKGADIVLEAFAELAASRPALTLTFAGPNTAPMRIGGRSYDCRAYIDSIMPPESARRVRLLGTVPFNELGRLRQRAFITVIGSRVEMFPNVLLEALAAGAPVVATRVGGIPEVVRDGAEALLAPAGEADAFAAAIAMLLDNPARAAALGAAGRRRVERDFTPARIAASTIDHYESVLERRARPASRKRRG
ncbi:MAG: glycosyltransferase family 4 protein [Amphiplicatus sp.]